MTQTAPATQSDALQPARPPKRRRLISAVVTLFLLCQIGIPVSYYLGDEPTSERFSWRMFSSIDLSTWDTRVIAVTEVDGRVVEREVPLAATLQETHVKTVQRAQLDLVEPFMRRVAQQPGVKEVRYEAIGTFPSGKPMKPIRLILKPGGELVKITDPAS